MSAGGIDIERLLPHRLPMRLVDTVLSVNDDAIAVEATIRADHPFLQANGVGAWVGIEYMAQSAACFAGWRALKRGEAEVPIGFLLGTRRFACKEAWFPLGSILTIHVAPEYEATDGLAAFACTIHIKDEEIARATITVFRPAK